MLPDNVITLLWMLVFFIIFYIYIDIRITKLRKEMLEHYRLCENIVTQGVSSVSRAVSSGSSRSNPLIGSAEQIFQAEQDYDSLIPSREETAYGLQTISGLKKDEQASWLGEAKADRDAQTGLQAYNISSDDGDYALFNGGIPP